MFERSILAEASYGASATRKKVKWYQTILRVVTKDATVPTNGNHNDSATRTAMRNFQNFYGMEPKSYLTVASNAALTQIALEWIYRENISNPVGRSGSLLKEQIKRFQRDYGLTPDGKVGPSTRAKMIDVLLGRVPTPVKDFHSQLGSAHQTVNELENSSLFDFIGEDDLEHELPSGIHGAYDPRPVIFPANIPWRWICRLKIDGLWGGTGVLISPRHVLTAAHCVYSDRNDSQGFRFYTKAKSISVSPAHDGHLLRRKRQFNKKAPFDTWPADLDRTFIPSCYTINLPFSEKPPTNHDCDLAVLTLKTPIGTQNFTAKKTIRENGRNKHTFTEFNPLRYWGFDDRHRIVAYKPKETDKFRRFTGGYPGSSKGIMLHVDGMIENHLINRRFTDKTHRYTVNLYENRFAHRIDTEPGQSGSPMWRTIKSSATIRNMIGIVTLAGRNANEGTALTPQFLRQIADWAPTTFSFDGRRLRANK